MKIWFVDDMPDNHRAWLNSFPRDLGAHYELRCFETVESLIAHAQIENPHILFIDYFIGPRIGSEVVEWFIRQPSRPLLIAHSSQASANDVMLALGADLSLEKIPGAMYTPSIRETVRSASDLEQLLSLYRPDVVDFGVN